MSAHREHTDDLAAAATLAALAGMGPSTLRAMLPDDADATEVVRSLRGAPAERVAGWRRRIESQDPDAELRRVRAAGIEIACPGDAGYPRRLADDHEAPAVLYVRGDTGRIPAIEHPTAAIIGTRRCTRAGRSTARQLGEALTEVGVVVVSGLAWGIDGAAHEGALRARCGAPPVAVVGSGLDVVYPKRHEQLWARVAGRGLILSEAPPGAQPDAWRFPARNRIIAALSDVVIVVESHGRGGSMITVDEAQRRGREVLAVPGPLGSPASQGANELLRDGCHPVLEPADIIAALNRIRTDVPALGPVRTPSDDEPAAPAAPVLPGPVAGGSAGAVLEALGHTPSNLEQLVVRSGRPLAEVSWALATLESMGRIVCTDGWYEMS
ncbi:MAG TPA: DNA-processing protein DprA [Acidimicrobiales bacterium]|jgi:DNA processing protein